MDEGAGPRRPLGPLSPAGSWLGERRQVELSRAQCLRLLGSVSLGRVVFSLNALPTLRPVNHVLADGAIYVRTHEAAKIASIAGSADASSVVLAYAADQIDPLTHEGWSVIATGYGELLSDPPQLALFRHLPLAWSNQPLQYAIRIQPTLITGYRLT